MKTELAAFRSIDMHVDEDNNIVIWPKSQHTKSAYFRNIKKGYFYVAYHPIELKAPWTKEQLAEKIQEGIEAWNKYEPYTWFNGQNTYEEKYFGGETFIASVAGTKLISVGWDATNGKRVTYALPRSHTYRYVGIDVQYLPDSASYMDFAKVVMKMIDYDYTNHENYKKAQKLILPPNAKEMMQLEKTARALKAREKSEKKWFGRK